MVAVQEGERIRVDGPRSTSATTSSPSGTRQTDETVAAAMEEARAGLAVQLEAFAANTMEYLRKERELLLDGVGVPDIRTDLEGRHVLVVVRGYHYKEDLQTLRHYVREYRPIIIGVDGGADAVLDAGLPLHLIVGDMDSVSDKALASGAEIVVHAYRDGRAPGPGARRAARASSRSCSRPPAPARTSRCCWPTTRAPSSSSRWAPTPRSSSSSTRAGPGWPARSSPGCGWAASSSTPRASAGCTAPASPPWQVLLLLVCGLLALFVAMSVTPAGQAALGLGGARWDDIWSWIQGLF